MRIYLLALLATPLVGCIDSATSSDAPQSPNQLQGDGKADGNTTLWAGLTVVALDQYASDACDDNQHPIGTPPVVFDEGTRETASFRNICFQVWQPGVTDTDDPNYSQQLDVEVHYRYGTSGDFKMAYVPALDHQGNNLRYAWALSNTLDPLEMAASLAAMPVPFHIDSEVPEPNGGGYAEIDSDMELYFTVNGAVLKTSANTPFDINYQGTIREPILAPSPSPYVLHPIVTCPGLSVGTGAGFYGADITDGSAIATLGAGASSLVYGPPTSMSTDGTRMSMVLDNETPIAGSTIPSFISLSGAKFEPDGTTLDLSLAVYDRTTSSTRSLTTSFANCVLAPAN